MATQNFTFTTLTGSETAGWQSINTLITSIDTQLYSKASGIATGGTVVGQLLRWNGTSWVAGTVGASGIDNNAVELGTKTTGNYVASVAGQAGEVDVTGSGSESAAVSVRLADNTALRGAATVASAPDFDPAYTADNKVVDTDFVLDALSYATTGGVTLSGDVTGATNANTISNNAVTNAKLADNAVNTAEIVNGAVTNAKLGLATGVPSTAGGGLTLIDSQTFTSSTTYTKPTNAKLFFIEFFTPGQGGSGGSSNGFTGINDVVLGGIGGNGGQIKYGTFNATLFSSSITVTVGAGGAGGAGGYTNITDTAGNATAGGIGGISYFGPVFAFQGRSYDNSAGDLSSASFRGSAGYFSAAGDGYRGIDNVNLINCSNYYLTGCSGGGGGGRAPSVSGTYSSLQNGGAGGGAPFTSYGSITAGGGASGGTAPGGNGSNGTVNGIYGLGGGGGASGVSVNGGNGGNGATPGGGGGGGGGTRINYTGGNGGNGGDGLIKIWVYG